MIRPVPGRTRDNEFCPSIPNILFPCGSGFVEGSSDSRDKSFVGGCCGNRFVDKSCVGSGCDKSFVGKSRGK